MDKRIEKAVVIGAGSAGLLTAVALRRLLPELSVRLVYDPEAPVIGVGESTTTYLPKFLHGILGLDRGEFFDRVNPVWKLGIRFEWGTDELSHYNYPFEDVMTVEDGSLRKPSAFYCMEDAADAGHFSALMDRDLAPCVVSNGRLIVHHGTAYHIDNPKFLAYLRGKAEEFGVEFTTGKVVGAEKDQSGDLDHLKLEGGETIEGDLFFDCSGFQSRLLSDHFDQKFVSYIGSVWCDRALVGSWDRTDAVEPYTLAETMRNGWCWKIGFLDHVNRGYVFSSEFCSPDEAAEEMRASNPQLGDDLKLIEFPSGRMENFWVRNVVAIGNSEAFVEPLESTGLHMAAESVAVVCGLLRDSNLRVIPEVLPVANQIHRRKWDDIRDFLAVHYRFNRRVDSPFWEHCRAETRLGNAEPLVELYRKAGPSLCLAEFIPPESIFGLDGYLIHLIGQRVETEFTNELDDLQSWRQRQDRIRREITGSIPVREAMKLVMKNPSAWRSRGV